MGPFSAISIAMNQPMKRSELLRLFIGCNVLVLISGVYIYLQTRQYQIKRQNDSTYLSVVLDISNKDINTNKSFESKKEDVTTFKSRQVVQECDCQDIFSEKLDEIERASRFNDSERLPLNYYITATTNCDEFIRKRGYIKDDLTEIERNFPIAYSILMYKAVEQCERLLRAIYRPQNIYCIHVDRKTDESIYKTMEAIANCFDNVFMTPYRFDVRWGTMTVLEPDLHCMVQLWKRSKTWKYFINLTGQEFPLKTNYELVRILTAYNGANDVSGTRKRANTERWLNAGVPPHGIIPTKGNVHVIASRAFVQFVLTDRRAKDFLEWCRLVDIPDEVFFSSIQHNAHLGIPGSYKGASESLLPENFTARSYLARFINWIDHNETCHGQMVRGVCIFGVGDLPLLAKRRELFVNKLYYEYQPLALDCLEELIFNRTRDAYLEQRDFDVQWYKNIKFVKYAL